MNWTEIVVAVITAIVGPLIFLVTRELLKKGQKSKNKGWCMDRKLPFEPAMAGMSWLN